MNVHTAPSLSRSRTPLPPRTILVVDDDEAVRSGLRCLLVTEGYKVVSAINGFQAVGAYRLEPCDLALIDMNMPLRNGWGAISNLRSLNPALPIIIITARPDQRTLAREAGVELMEKPLDPASLLQRIKQLLSAPLEEPTVSHRSSAA